MSHIQTLQPPHVYPSHTFSHLALHTHLFSISLNTPTQPAPTQDPAHGPHMPPSGTTLAQDIPGEGGWKAPGPQASPCPSVRNCLHMGTLPMRIYPTDSALMAWLLFHIFKKRISCKKPIRCNFNLCSKQTHHFFFNLAQFAQSRTRPMSNCNSPRNGNFYF